MNCKYCQQMLDAGNSVCPHCGKDNAVNEEEMTALEQEPTVAEETPAEPAAKAPEIKKGITLTTGKLTALIVGAVVLTALVIGLVLQGAGFFTAAPEQAPSQPVESMTTPVDEPVQTTAPVATIPADGNPDDETCKGSYTVSDEEAAAAMNTVVATCGEAELTNGQLQVYYWMQVQQFLQNYGSYAPYFGLNYTEPLDTQVCTLVEGDITWQQFFLRQALDSWQNYQSMANESAANGLTLSAENQASLDGLEASLVTESGLQGFDSVEGYLVYHVGPGASIADYTQFMETYFRGYEYFESQYEGLLPNEEEVQAYFQENAASYEEQGILEDTRYVDARHILVFPEGGTTDESGNTTYTEEEWAACEAAAQAILDEWLAGEANEESFASLAVEKSADGGSSSNGGLYEDMYVGQMVEPFETWCFDESRQYGDYGLVRTSYGYHVMFFVGAEPAWKTHAEDDLISQRANDMVEDIMALYPMTVDYKAIKLGLVDMSQ